jgi:hypothetical protein
VNPISPSQKELYSGRRRRKLREPGRSDRALGFQPEPDRLANPAGTFLGPNRFPERGDDPFFDSEIDRSGRLPPRLIADHFVSIELLTAPPRSGLLAIVAGHRSMKLPLASLPPEKATALLEHRNFFSVFHSESRFSFSRFQVLFSSFHG